jgi:UDP-glucose-4-epimerase GalE
MLNNAHKSVRLIEAAVRHGVEALVFSSTCAVYGPPQTELLAETHSLAPGSPYACSKEYVETRLDRAADGGLRSASLRFFNAAGASTDGKIGEAHKPETHLIPLAIDAALGVGPPLVIHGADYGTTDGTCIRDFVHVADIALAHLLVAQWLLDQKAAGCHEVFYLGSGTGYSVAEIIRLVGRVVGRRVPHSTGERRPGDAVKLVGDVCKAKRLLSWYPQYGIESLIEDALRWRLILPRIR